MSWLLISLCCVLLFTDGVKMSLMPMKVSMIWSLLWGISGYLATIMFADMSKQEVFGLLNLADISTFEFIELLIISGYIFSAGIIKKILYFYPGLMIIVPVCVVSYLFTYILPGFDFTLAALVSGFIIFCVLAGLTLLLRYLAVDYNVLYRTVLVSFMVNIIIYGLL